MAAPSDWSRFLAAIRAQESGGNYTQDTAGCLGAYCWEDQGSWATMASAAGQGSYAQTNPSQVPDAVQDKVASTNLYRIYQQAGGGAGGLSAAARWWNGGTTQSVPNPGLPAQPWAPKCGAGSSGAYACQVLTRMGLGGHYLAGSGSGSGAGGTVTLTSAQQANCALGFNGTIPVIPGVYSQTVTACFVTKSEARALYGGLLVVAGGILLLVGGGLIAYFAGGIAVAKTVVAPVVAVVSSTAKRPQGGGGGAAGGAAGGGGGSGPTGGGGGMGTAAEGTRQRSSVSGTTVSQGTGSRSAVTVGQPRGGTRTTAADLGIE